MSNHSTVRVPSDSRLMDAHPHSHRDIANVSSSRGYVWVSALLSARHLRQYADFVLACPKRYMYLRTYKFLIYGSLAPCTCHPRFLQMLQGGTEDHDLSGLPDDTKKEQYLQLVLAPLIPTSTPNLPGRNRLQPAFARTILARHELRNLEALGNWPKEASRELVVCGLLPKPAWKPAVGNGNEERQMEHNWLVWISHPPSTDWKYMCTSVPWRIKKFTNFTRTHCRVQYPYLHMSVNGSWVCDEVTASNPCSGQ